MNKLKSVIAQRLTDVSLQHTVHLKLEYPLIWVMKSFKSMKFYIGMKVKCMTLLQKKVIVYKIHKHLLKAKTIQGLEVCQNCLWILSMESLVKGPTWKKICEQFRWLVQYFTGPSKIVTDFHIMNDDIMEIEFQNTEDFEPLSILMWPLQPFVHLGLDWNYGLSCKSYMKGYCIMTLILLSSLWKKENMSTL